MIKIVLLLVAIVLLNLCLGFDLRFTIINIVWIFSNSMESLKNDFNAISLARNITYLQGEIKKLKIKINE